MKVRDLNSYYNVMVSRAEVKEFKSKWPCSSLPDRAIIFQFDKRNGDLVDMWPLGIEGSDCLALSQDAQAYGKVVIDKNKLAGIKEKGD